MKTYVYKWLSCLVIVSLSAILTAQTGITPNGISYQAVARDASGKELVNMPIWVKFSIIDENNNADWVETHSVTTDPFGLFNLTIGNGSRDASSQVDNFADIPWGVHHYMLKVEISTDQDNDYRSVGSMPLLSVPYALYAATSGTALNGGKDEQKLSYDNTNHVLSLENGGSVDLSGLTSGDITNALISNVEVRDNILYITQGEQTQSVNLSQFAQNLTFNAQNNTLSLSGNAAPVDLSQYQYTISWDPVNQHYNLVNGLGQINGATIDLATYKQTLSIAGRTLSISNGNSIALPPDADIDSTNELQSLSILNNQLSLINRNGTPFSTVNLSQFLQDLTLDADNNLIISNDPTPTKQVNLSNFKQSLSLSGRILSISNGNSIDLPDIDSTNELQSLSLQNNQLSLINKNGSTYSTANLSSYQQDLKLYKDTLRINNNPSATPIDLLPYKQTLSLNGRTLSISNGNSIAIPPDADNDSTNELQSLSLQNNQLSLINKNGSTYSTANLSPYLQDLKLYKDTLRINNNPSATPINLLPYKQALSLSGRTLSISNGNSIIIPPDADNDSTNELQSLSLQNNQLSLINKNGSTYSTANLSPYLQDLKLANDTLKITNNTSATAISLKKYLDNTDNQQLSLSNGQLSLTNGGTVNIRENLYAFRAVNNINKNLILYDSVDFIFPTEKLDLGNAYDKNAGTFTVPSGGAGLYEFNVSYQYSGLYDLIRVVVNDSVVETLQHFTPTYSFILNLNDNDVVKLRVVNTGSTMIFNGIGSFMGFRINQ